MSLFGITFEETMAFVMLVGFILMIMQTRRHIRMIKNRQEQIKLWVQFFIMMAAVTGAFLVFYLSKIM